MYTITRLSDESIVVVRPGCTLEQYIDQFGTICARIQGMVIEAGLPYYVITDLSYLPDIAYSDILLGLEEYDSMLTNAPHLRQVEHIVVGTHPMIGVLLKRARAQFNMHLAHFPTIEPALASARARLREARQTANLSSNHPVNHATGKTAGKTANQT